MKLKLLLFGLCLVSSCFNILLAQDVFDAARKGNVKQMLALINLKHDTINATNQNGFTPLILACYYSQKEIVEILIKEGVDLEKNSPEGTALLAAVYKGDIEITKMFLLHKVNINASNNEGNTALMFSVMSGNLEMVKLLLSHGADKNILSKHGSTAFTLAKKYAFKEIEMLLNNN
jgi:ankyrin repeat protein